MKLIVDSSIFIDHLRGGTIGIQLLNRAREEDEELFIPTIVIYELFSGKSSKDPTIKKIIDNYIHDFKRIDLTEEIALRAGELYRDIGKHIGAQDYIIAASALKIGARVVTLNKKHFEQIPGLSLYSF